MYIINKGNHYASGLHFWPHLGMEQLSYGVIFTRSCLYPQNNVDQKFDLNKLCGYTHGKIHDDSIRFAWVPSLKNNQEIELWLYCYSFGELTINYICNVKIDEPYELSILENRTKIYTDYTLIVSGYEIHTIKSELRVATPIVNWGRFCWPFIGGTEPAQHKTVIMMERLYDLS